jgi:hypothetical protein
MAHSLDTFFKNFHKVWAQFRFYLVRGLYYGIVPSMFLYGEYIP